MEELKVNIRYVILWEFDKNKEVKIFMDKVSLQTTKSENGFESFVLALYHGEINPVHDTQQTSIKML